MNAAKASLLWAIIFLVLGFLTIEIAILPYIFFGMFGLSIFTLINSRGGF